MAKYARRHYRDVAGIIRDRLNHARSEDCEKFLQEIGGDFSALFAEDNYNFQPRKFYRACGFED